MFAQCTFASEYDADISFIGNNITKYDFEKIVVPLTVKNTGSKKWDSFAAKYPVFLSYHLLSKKDGNMLSYNNIRTPLQQKVLPGETSFVNLQLQLPPRSAGEYIIRVDLVA